MKSRKCALYRHWSRDNRLLYVGISYNPVHRTDQHIAQSDWALDIAWVSVEYFETRAEAERAERAAITNEAPMWNKQHCAQPRCYATELAEKHAAALDHLPGFTAKTHILAWNPGTADVAVLPIYRHKEHFDLDLYSSTALACYADIHRVGWVRRQLTVFMEAVCLMVRDNCAPAAVHNAMMALEEYRDGLPEDMLHGFPDSRTCAAFRGRPFSLPVNGPERLEMIRKRNTWDADAFGANEREARDAGIDALREELFG